jgi:hypothetical protein
MKVVVKGGAELEVAMCQNGSGGQSGCIIQSGHE